jgi:hydrogenase small subunit
VLLLDADLLAVSKPGGVPVQRTLDPGRGNLLDGVTAFLAAQGEGGEGQRPPALLTRLPASASGVVLLARTRSGARSLEAQLQRGAVRRLFVLVVEGSIPNEQINGDGYWTSMGNDPATGEPITLNTWIDRLAPRAWAVVAVGTCATYGGIHAMAGNPTGCMGLADYLGWGFRSVAGIPIVNVPGCPVQPDNFMETLTWLLYQAAGLAPMIPLDQALRPTWLFGKTVHEGCDRAGYYEQGDFARDYNSPKCLVRVGCWGPVVNCNVPKRGWMNGIGGCPNVGGICIGCTMPGFPDKFMPFMDEPPGATLSSALITAYGPMIRKLRGLTNHAVNKEPRWRHNRPELTAGYQPRWPQR